MTNPNQPSRPHSEPLSAQCNDTYVRAPVDKCIPDLIADQVRCSPDATAVVFHDQQLTFRELDDRAARLAGRLRRLGATAEVVVAICAERSLDMIIGLLAILKSGAAYLPLDPAFPAERLKFMLEDSNARLLLTQGSLLTQLPATNVEKVLIDSAGQPEYATAANTPSQLQSHNLAYVIYTSGSTGTPKGVMVEHRQVVNFFSGMDQVIGGGPGVWLAVTSISFDISVLELFWTLARGMTVVIQSEADRLASGGRSISAQIRKYGVTHLQCTPSLARLLALNGECMESFRFLQKLILGGEPLSSGLVAQLLPALTGSLINLYGPTETTVWSTAYLVQGDETVIPIGRPIVNTSLYILDEHLETVAIGVPGELFIGGLGVTRGYLGRPELTRERFIADPFALNSAGRLYRTGDLARQKPDGNVEFLGRVDNQVKILGLRIEPEEIENTLSLHPNVAAAAVVPSDNASGEKELMGYVVLRIRNSVTVSELRIYLHSRLPKQMVPVGLFIVDSLPTTPNGKTDRKALAIRRPTTDAALPGISSANELEQLIAKICSEILQVQDLSIDRNFLELGLMSLQIAEAAARLRDALHRDIPLTDFFEYSTVRTLAGYLMGESRASSPARGRDRGQSRRDAIRARMK